MNYVFALGVGGGRVNRRGAEVRKGLHLVLAIPGVFAALRLMDFSLYKG